MATGVTHGCNFFAAPHDVAHLFVQGFVIAVETQVAVAVIDDQKVAEPAQPVGEDDPAGSDCSYFLAGPGRNEEALPNQPAVLSWSAEAVRKFPADRKCQPAA